MEAKRSATQSFRKASKTQVITPSDVSLTSSKAAEQSKLNTRKNPLDALSRMSLRQQTIEKRSGLQDVDEEYLKRNVFAKPNFQKHSGLNDMTPSNVQLQNKPAAGQPTGMGQNGGDDGTMQNQAQAQIQVQQQAQQAAQAQQQAGHAQVQQGQAQAYMQGHNQAHINTHNQMHGHAHNQGQGQAQAPAQAQAQQQQQALAQAQNMANKNQAANAPQSVPVTVAPGAEPDLCATCPHCQTTIYLVRCPDSMPEASVPMSHIPQGNMMNVPAAN